MADLRGEMTTPHKRQKTKRSQPEASREATSTPRRKAATHAPQDDVPATAVARRAPARAELALEHARLCARIGDENRGKDILLLDLRGATPLVDFFVVITATSRRQSHAIASEVDQEMKKLGEHKLGLEDSEDGRWTLIDYGDFVVHVLSADARSYYALEDIWGDAERLDWQDAALVRPASHRAAEAE